MNTFLNECPSFGGDQYLRNVTAEEVRMAFTEHPEDLEWLAVFLTADKQLAEVCMADACVLATAANDVSVLCLEPWTRRCTIRSAIEMQHFRLMQLAAIYERTPCTHRNHIPLAPAVLDLLYEGPEKVGPRLDTLCRAVLVLRGIEGYSPNESALILGVSPIAVEAAYCAALRSLQILSCQLLMDLGIAAQPCC
jgi:hypothetical protein